jgi:alpha,alpha-trehalose phosphorylase
VTDAEVAIWRDAAARMHLPYDGKLGIHEQDDSFLSKKVWDFANTPKENYPLLLNYHPMVIYRHQVCKQADVVLALLLLSNEFTLHDKRRDFDYYEAVTTHDSSLSSCIFSIIASEVGYHDKAYDYFMETARLDLDDTHGNTHYGVHTAAMAGTWMGVAYGFAGMRVSRWRTALRPDPAEAVAALPVQDPAARRPAAGARRCRRGRVHAAAGDSLNFTHLGQPVALTRAAPNARIPMEAQA